MLKLLLALILCLNFNLILPLYAAEKHLQPVNPTQQTVKYPQHTARPFVLPASVNYMRVPQEADFVIICNTAGNYALSLPKSIGVNQLEQFADVNGPMLFYAKDETTLAAVTVLDPADAVYYRSAQPLPNFDGKKIIAKWQQGGSDLLCTASAQQDFYGSKLIVEAQKEVNGKTYQLLYICPLAEYGYYAPQILYSLNSFTVMK